MVPAFVKQAENLIGAWRLNVNINFVPFSMFVFVVSNPIGGNKNSSKGTRAVTNTVMKVIPS